MKSFISWTLKRGALIWTVAILLAIPATWRTANLYLHLRSELEELLPRESPSVKAIDELRARMAGLQYLGVVIDAGEPSKVPAAEKFIDDLAARVEAYPKDLVARVRLGNSVERKFLEKNAAVYTDVADLEAIKTRIEARRDYEVSKETGALLDDTAPPPSLDFSDIEAKYKEKTGGGGNPLDDDRYASREKHLVLMLVEVGEFTTARGRSAELLSRVKADVASLDPGKYAPGMRVGYTSDVAVSVEELEALLSDLSVSTLVVIACVLAVIVLYYRWWRSVLALLPPLLLAAVYSFALASVLPLDVHELNSNTAFLGSIIVGNGINFGIVVLARYVEERRAGRSVEESLVAGAIGARAGTLAAALAAGVSYASLTLTDFRGFRQFGVIGGIGMVMSWAVAYVLMPPLVAWIDRGGKTAPQPRDEGQGAMAWLARSIVRWPVVIVAAAAMLTAGAAWTVRRAGPDDLEYDFSKLRRADTWKNGDGYWSGRQNDLLGTYLTPIVILTDDVDQARAIAADVREQMKRSPLRERLANVRTIDDVLPPDEPAKIAIAADIREDMTPKMRSLVAPDKREEIDKLLSNEDPKPLSIEDLPPSFTVGLRENDGTIGSAVLVYPHLSHALWEGPPLAEFVGALRAIANAHVGHTGKPGRVAGSLPLSADILDSIRRDGVKASAFALLGVIGVVILLFRRQLATSALVIGSLLVGVLWLGALTMIFHVKINFANFIAFPITFGIGVDYAVNVMSRYVGDGDGDVARAVRSTGGAVTLCSMTTIIGYSSLLLAQNRALFLFGLVAVMGEIACLTAGVVVLPAVLAFFRRPRVEAIPSA